MSALAYSPAACCSPPVVLTGSCGSTTCRSTSSWRRCPTGARTGAISSVAFAPNGATLATGSSDGRVRLFTVSQDKLTLVSTASANTPPNPADESSVSGEYGSASKRRVRAVRFDACRGQPGRQGSALRRFGAQPEAAGHGISPEMRADSVTSVAFAPGGAVIAAGIGDGIVQLVDVSARGTEARTADRRRPTALRDANPRYQLRVRSARNRCSRLAGAGGTVRLIGYLTGQALARGWATPGRHR